MSAEVRVAAEGEERDAFDALPLRLYAGDPAWSPGSVEVAEQCFADSAAGRVRLHPVVVVRSGAVVARAAGILDPAAPDVDGRPQGWIGLVECLPGEQRAGVRAVQGCRRWLDEIGVGSVVAPRSSPLVAGLLVDGFERPQTFLTNHNPRWYAPMFEAAGLRVVSTMRSFEFTRAGAPHLRGVRPRGFHVRRADAGHLREELAAVAGLQEAVFAGRQGHRRRSADQMRELMERIRPGLDPDLVVLAEDPGGRTIGALICLVDAWQRRPPGTAPDRARLLSAGVVAEWRRRGVAIAMGKVLATTLLDKGYQVLEASWVLSDNQRPQVVVRALGGRPTRRFALLS